MTIGLALDKYIALSEDIIRLIKSGYVIKAELETLISHLNHATLVLPNARYFMGRLCHLLSCLLHKNSQAHLSKETLADLELWLSFLKQSHLGTSINLVVEWYPNHVYITDSYENGIGEYSLFTDQAFCFELANHLKGCVDNNVLEYLAKIVGI